MHEFGLMSNIAETVQKYALKNKAEKVIKIILEIGEISGVVPEYLKFYFEPCSKGTILQNAEFEINIKQAIGKCRKCKKDFGLLKNNFVCPVCGKDKWDMISGKEMNIMGIEVI